MMKKYKYKVYGNCENISNYYICDNPVQCVILHKAFCIQNGLDDGIDYIADKEGNTWKLTDFKLSLTKF